MIDENGIYIETAADKAANALNTFVHYFDIIFPIVGTIAAVLLIIWLVRHWK